jgi:putative restriction endonuclease
LILRTIGSVVRKLGNFGAVDERLRAFNISGLVNYSNQDKEIFDEFVNNWEALVSESQNILDKLNTDKGITLLKPIEETAEKDIIAEFSKLSKMPTEKQASVNIRIRQSFFRRAVLSNYDNKCCISGLDIPELLIASHIIPWKNNENSRIDPQNGLLLSAIHDKAFDIGLITITPDHRVRISKRIFKSKSEFLKPSIIDFDGKEINIQSKFLPKQEYLHWHNKNKFVE